MKNSHSTSFEFDRGMKFIRAIFFVYADYFTNEVQLRLSSEVINSVLYLELYKTHTMRGRSCLMKDIKNTDRTCKINLHGTVN